ncbi:CaiB/BaiF CoA transferase family protein [Sphingosinicella rhizophila]|uniref:CaiB/BaiF CoA-transferase family protein n=1 Tax=Sphingosinicella rhizophila TaxID=3050082 RepID=A0ABU3Q526_9SPHN|nr:CaiB/BaiF CoA-transferase family protein [Sphingosinicella sp. GR2756]MDT9598518.1 CaiB/BaiF CoA-transferase family protein [Sphingosinicella sp. GR2756]
MNEVGKGPLSGVRVVEFTGIGPGPHCAMLLSDLGAEILRIEKEGGNGWPNAIADRGRATATVDIRTDAGRAFCLEVCARADVVIEGFRPGVMERLGLGPEVLLGCNPRLVYGRVTGWGQDGPLAQAAGHDINYIALAGALDPIGEKGGRSIPPLNLVGDFGGGSMLLAFGIVAALFERGRSGLGQVVDAAIVDGVSSLMSFFDGLRKDGQVSLDRSENVLAGAAPFYRTYHCRDGREVAIGSLETKFYRSLLELIGAPVDFLSAQYDASTWPERGEMLAAIFVQRDLADWVALLEGTDACFAPVLKLGEVADHPHMKARSAYVSKNGRAQCAPVPRFSRTPGEIQDAKGAEELLEKWRAS